MDQAQQRHHRGFARVRRNLHVGEALQQHLPDAVDLAPPQLVGEALGRLTLLRRQCSGASARLRTRREVKFFHEAPDERTGIDSEIMRLIQIDKSRGGITAKDVLQKPADEASIRQTQHVADLLGGNCAAAMGNRLVEN